ncbi:flagellar protein FlgN [Lichenibacterium ramalinae]|uniref:Flagellar protein FlgN n=1 Tax=Lichenibacterium ramalinae TaxID=2316527 RepID=A0A4Q2RBG7_9HYPH|nr:flagellar protein FlgN [Lichenibacterium ramalinae]RYB03038.1 flagellar protein FlgN [Lichenibacterium ramalinae]
MTKGQGQALGSIFGTTRRRAASPAAPAPEAATPAVVMAFIAVVDRVEGVVEAETEALTRNLPADMTELGNRKRQGLLEMSRALKAAAAAGPRAEIRDRLARFAGRLERNRAVLGTQLFAVREIAEIIAQTLQDADSDGTYSATAGRS